MNSSLTVDQNYSNFGDDEVEKTLKEFLESQDDVNTIKKEIKHLTQTCKQMGLQQETQEGWMMHSIARDIKQEYKEQEKLQKLRATDIKSKLENVRTHLKGIMEAKDQVKSKNIMVQKLAVYRIVISSVGMIGGLFRPDIGAACGMANSLLQWLSGWFVDEEKGPDLVTLVRQEIQAAIDRFQNVYINLRVSVGNSKLKDANNLAILPAPWNKMTSTTLGREVEKRYFMYAGLETLDELQRYFQDYGKCARDKCTATVKQLHLCAVKSPKFTVFTFPLVNCNLPTHFHQM